MDDIKTVRQASNSDPPAGFGQAAQTFVEQGQLVTQQLSELGQEVSDFMKSRLERNTQAARSLAQCRSFPEAMEVQLAWLRTAVDDYAKQMLRLAEINGKMLSGYGSQDKKPATPTSGAKTPMRVSG